MKTPTMLSCLLSFLLMSSAAVPAQDLPFAFGPSDAQGLRADVIGAVRGPEVGLIAIEPFEVGRPVKDAPYTAEAIETIAFADPIEQRIRHHRTRQHGECAGSDRGICGLIMNSRCRSCQSPIREAHLPSFERRIAYRIKTALPLRGDFGCGLGSQGGGGHLRFSVGGETERLLSWWRATATLATPISSEQLGQKRSRVRLRGARNDD